MNNKTFWIKIKRLFLKTLTAWLLAALVAAAAAVIIFLLYKNRARDGAEAQRQSAQRDADIAERARLSAGMMGVLFSDMQTGLAASLNSAPGESAPVFLERWRDVNPFIAAALPVNIRGTPEPGAHWPDELAREYGEASRPPAGYYSKTPLPPIFKDWLATTPWRPGVVAEKPPPSGAAQAAASWERLREKLRAAAARDPWHLRGASGDDSAAAPIAVGSVDSVDSAGSAGSAGSAASLPPDTDYTNVESRPERRRRTGTPFVERAGWDAVPGSLFLWRVCDDDLVLAASVDLRQLEKMLAPALPSGAQDGARYTLLAYNEGGADSDSGSARVPRAASGVAPDASSRKAGDAFVRDFPIQPELLPGWAVRVTRAAPGGGAAVRDAILYTSYVAFVVLAAALFILALLIFQRQMRNNEKNATLTDYASHEMRTAVQEILCCTDPDALAAGVAGAAGEKHGETHGTRLAAEHAGIINHAARRLSEIVSFVLDFFPRITRGGKIWRENINLQPLAATVLDDIKTKLRKGGVRMDFTTNIQPENAAWVETNDNAVSIILRNVLDNACLHGGAGGRVDMTLDTDARTGMIEIRVRDYGRGIPRAELKRIFKPRWLPKEDERGHGIGLPLSRKLARALGGDLTCRIPPDGKGGCLFALSLQGAIRSCGSWHFMAPTAPDSLAQGRVRETLGI